jgi:hypothetical protein
MGREMPALVTETKIDNDNIKDVKVRIKRKVTYIFEIVSADNLSIPYAVAINGASREKFKNKPARVSGEKGRIVVNDVEPGQQVALFLNSDAHPAYRKNPVYLVAPQSRDVIINIKEKMGKNSETDELIKRSTKDSEGTEVDYYEAALTGDIWQKISHKYSVQEVESLLPVGTNELVAVAVKKIYAGLTNPSLTIKAPNKAPNVDEKIISINFVDGDNPRNNIKNGYEFLSEGLTRVHPAGYAAMFSAAVEAGVEKIVMTSAWRPMLGSIAHRAGLGLDVNFIGNARINREELRKEKAVHTTNVSEQEKNLFKAFQMAKTQQEAAKHEVATANLEVKKAAGEPAKIIAAKEKMKTANEASEAADNKRKDAEIAWNAERDRNEPDEVRRFRSSLLKCKSVAQIFDPWFMDQDSRDNVAPIPNFQISQNEKLHAHHLHITVCEPKIL